VFLYRLALELGIPYPEKWKKRLTVRQLRKWMAFWRVEPFGDAWRMAARTSLTTAAGMGAKPDPEAEERFLPSYKEKQQTEDDIRRELMKIPAFREQMQKGE
jgi:hypothetical protein